MTHDDRTREVELKLTAPPAALHDAFAAVGGGAAKGATKRLTAVYFDTADRRLVRHGAALRVRRDGTGFTQTLKAARGPLERLEHEAPVDGTAPDLAKLPREALATRVGALFDDELQPVFATDVERRVRRVEREAGTVELALDAGEIRAGERRAPVSELEIELEGGATSALFAVAAELVDAGATRLVMGSKAQRGYELAAGAAPGWAKADRTALGRRLAVGDALGLVLDGVLRHLWANHDAAFDGRDPEGVHQLRVAVRRLRSALALFGKVVEPARLARFKAEARWAMAALGPARDRDVFATEMLPPVAAARPNDPALAALRVRAEEARATAYAELRDAMASARWTRFVLDLARWITLRGWYEEADAGRQLALAEPLPAFAARMLDRRAKAVKKRGKHFETLDAVHRHEVRKSLKKLRYAADFFRDLYPEKPTKRYLKRLSTLQDAFGHLNDVATADDLSATLVDADAPRLAEGRGLVLGWYGHAASFADAELVRDWHDFLDAEPFWRGG